MSLRRGAISVVLATDSSLIGDGLVSLLATIEDVAVVGRTASYLQLLELVEEVRPDGAIVTMRSPLACKAASVVVAVHRLRHVFPRLGVVVVSDHDGGSARELLRDGAASIAYLMDEQLLDVGMLLDALREVCAGRSVLDPGVVDALVNHYGRAPAEELTRREPDVLARISMGLSNQAIASELHISVKAIEKDITAIFRKLDLPDRTFVDRRVSAAIRFLQTRENPFGTKSPAVGAYEDGADEEEGLPWATVIEHGPGRATDSFAERLGDIGSGGGSGGGQPVLTASIDGQRSGAERIRAGQVPTLTQGGAQSQRPSQVGSALDALGNHGGAVPPHIGGDSVGDGGVPPVRPLLQ